MSWMTVKTNIMPGVKMEDMDQPAHLWSLINLLFAQWISLGL